LGRKFNETYYTEFEMAINYITDVQGAYAILDPHNYMRWVALCYWAFSVMGYDG